MSRPGFDPSTALDRLESLDDERQALELRLAGNSYRAIADLVGCHPSTAHDRVERALARLAPREEAEQVRQLEAERLDALTLTAHEVLRRALDGERPNLDTALAAIDRALRVSARRAALLGLDVERSAPTDGEVERQIADLVAELTTSGVWAVPAEQAAEPAEPAEAAERPPGGAP